MHTFLLCVEGMLVGVPFVAYSSGILIVYALGSFLHWRLAAWCGLLLPMLSFMAILVAPESPTWLARKGYYEKARKGRKKNPLIKLRSLSFSGRLTVHPLKAPIKINNFSPFFAPPFSVRRTTSSSPQPLVYVPCKPVHILRPTTIQPSPGCEIQMRLRKTS